MSTEKGLLFGFSLSVLLFAGTAVLADTLSPKDTYLKYRAALPAAQKIDDVKSFMCKKVNKEIDETPADMKPMMFGLIKGTAPKTVQVLSEEVKGETATIQLTGKSEPDKIDGNKVKEELKGKVTFVREDGAWKIDKESWTGKVQIGGE